MSHTEHLSSDRAVAPTFALDHALFLDFDGTLAPLQDDPDTVALPPNGEACLLQLSKLLDGALVLISGRDVRDLSARTPQDVWRAGGHGLEVCRPGEAPNLNQAQVSQTLLEEVEAVIARYEETRVEQKGRVLAIHYRQNPQAGPALFEDLKTIIAAVEDYKIQHGKMVIELKPSGTDKGTALKLLMQQAPFQGRIPVMVGDDTTDEDAMAAAISLGGFGIKVGAGETCAKHRLDDPAAVWDWLKGIVNEHA